MPEYIPPQDLNAEQATLGSMMLEPAAIDAVLRMGLTSKDFYRPNHQALFTILVEMHEQSKPIDETLLPFELRERGLLDEIGGMEYLMAVVESVPTAANVVHYTEIVIEKSLLRQAQMTSINAQQMIREGADPKDVVSYLSTESERLQLVRGSGLIKVGDLLLPHYSHLADSTDKQGLDGYTTGYSKLDIVTGGYGGPVFVTFKARRGSGKTHHLIQTSVYCLRAGMAAVVISMDTPKELMLNRYLAHLTGLDSRRVKRPRADDWDLISEASAWMHDMPLYFWWEADITVSQIRAMCKAVQSEGHKIGLVGIDYAELLGSEKSSQSREQELSGIAKGLKNLRDELGTTILLLSQTNKQGGERWSEGIGNAGDIIVSWELNKGQANSGQREGALWTEKNRLGPDVKIDCICDLRTSRIREDCLDYSDPTYPPSWPWWFNCEEMDFEENPNPWSMPGERSTPKKEQGEN